MNIFELLLFYGPMSDDVMSITERMILSMIENKIKFFILFVSFWYSSAQIAWFLYRMYLKPDINYACVQAPMVFTCYFSSVANVQIYLRHSYFKKSVSFIKTNFWSKELATKEAKNEISAKIGHFKLLVLVLMWGVLATVLTYIPYNFNYADSPIPFMDFLGYIDIPEKIKRWLAIILYMVFFPMAYSVPSMGIVVTYYVSNFMTQTIMLKWSLINITKDLEITVEKLTILDDVEIQKIIEKRLIKCVKHHIMLRRYGQIVEDYFFYNLIWHLIGIVSLIASLIYIILFQEVGISNQTAALNECITAAFGTYMYCFLGECLEFQIFNKAFGFVSLLSAMKE